MGGLGVSLLIGVSWGLWHLPFFVFEEGASVGGGRRPALVRGARHSLVGAVLPGVPEHGKRFLAILGHASVNTTVGSLGLLGPGSGGALVALFAVLTWLAVAAIVWRWGPVLAEYPSPAT